jgi:hypothetical protein
VNSWRVISFKIECLIVDEVQLNQADAFGYRRNYSTALTLTAARFKALKAIYLNSLTQCASAMRHAGTPLRTRVSSLLHYYFAPPQY